MKRIAIGADGTGTTFEAIDRKQKLAHGLVFLCRHFFPDNPCERMIERLYRFLHRPYAADRETDEAWGDARQFLVVGIQVFVA